MDALASTLVPSIDTVPSRNSPASRVSSRTYRNAASIVALFVRRKVATVSWSGFRLDMTNYIAM